MDFMKRWMARQIHFGSLDSRRSVYVFALRMALRATILAIILNSILLPILFRAGLLPMTFPQAVWFSVAVSWLVGGTVSGALAVFTGHAIYDLAVSRAEFERLSRTDGLSGLLNRRAFSEILEATDEDASLVIFDIDRFKSVNDEYGHSAGDAVIQGVSAALAGAVPDNSKVARLGGEEFGAILTGGTVEERLSRIERVRDAIARESINFDGVAVRITISAGVADIWHGRRKEAVYSGADKALYLAKTAGRNRVVHERDGFGAAGHGHAADVIGPANESAA